MDVDRVKILFSMLKVVNEGDRCAVARLLELLVDHKPWHRSLWGVGIVLAMDELREACAATRQGLLSDGAVKRIASSLQKRVGVHPALSAQERQFLQQQLQQVPRVESVAHFGIAELSRHIETDCLVRWGRAAGAVTVSSERFARGVASHLLDAGFSGRYMHGVIREHLDGDNRVTLAELCNALQARMDANPCREFEVLIALASMPELPGGVPSTWLRGAAVIQWLRTQGFETAGVRSPVAMVLKVQARDVYGAATAARDVSDRFAARTLIATGKPLFRTPWLWVRGAREPESLQQASRGVGVRELFREDRVFSCEVSHGVDAALELLAHLDGSSMPAAVAGGWAAIEGLLAEPNDRASAADNLATLVACSFPRAELTALSYRIQTGGSAQGDALSAATSNRDRCHVLARMIVEDRLPPLSAVGDQATVARMRKLLANPAVELQAVRDAICDCFHRLYRQRNLILHGARLDGIALGASLRTAAKLVGAGMDRITHGHYVQRLKPMELVARANLSLALLDRASPLACVDLLEGR